jgi:AAA domain-containing protein
MMVTTRIAIFARKGGAGKTALTALLGRELVRQGVRVLVVDLDPQVVSISTSFGIDTNAALPFTAMDLIAGPEGRPFHPHAVIPGKLDVVPGSQEQVAILEHALYELFKRVRAAAGISARPRRAILDVRLAAVEVGYDCVLLDCLRGGLRRLQGRAGAHLWALLTPVAVGAAVTGLYSGGVYFTPIIGGFIADRFSPGAVARRALAASTSARRASGARRRARTTEWEFQGLLADLNNSNRRSGPARPVVWEGRSRVNSATPIPDWAQGMESLSRKQENLQPRRRCAIGALRL